MPRLANNKQMIKRLNRLFTELSSDVYSLALSALETVCSRQLDYNNLHRVRQETVAGKLRHTILNNDYCPIYFTVAITGAERVSSLPPNSLTAGEWNGSIFLKLEMTYRPKKGK